MDFYGSKSGTISSICRTSRQRLMQILSVILAAFLLVIILSNPRLTSKSHSKPTSKAVLPPSHGSPLEQDWQTIHLKGKRVKDRWSVSGEGILFRRVYHKWTNKHQLCDTNETLNPLTFSTPGGSVTIYMYDVDDKVRIEQAKLPLLTPILKLMAEDTTVTFIDIGADIGVYSLAVASLGNPVVAVEPYLGNLPKLCHGIIDSKLVGRCYVVTNALLETNKVVKVRPSLGYIKYEYAVVTQLNRKGNVTISIRLSELLEEYPMSQAGIRIGTHDNVTRVLAGAIHFFKEVQVKFVQVSWYYVLTNQYERFILKFLQARGFKPYGYWTQFTLLDTREPRTWPDNVIFRKSDPRFTKYLRSP